ncbi:MAG TPA: SRPBCC domain-containing protein [Candidatus Sulfotelmatobacter sp.]|nr:SRPBCC domain-containing protein [Candidatus Sulfotelmatobacter sp.]
MIDHSPTTPAADERIVMKRVFAAPRERVFAAWTTAEHFARWFGPDGCTTEACTLDARPGGSLRFHMLCEGMEPWIGGTYREVVAPERIVLRWGFQDEAGNRVHATTYGLSEQHPLETVVTVTLVERDGRTEMTMEQTVPRDFPERDQMRAGWTMGFNHLAALLATP